MSQVMTRGEFNFLLWDAMSPKVVSREKRPDLRPLYIVLNIVFPLIMFLVDLFLSLCDYCNRPLRNVEVKQSVKMLAPTVDKVSYTDEELQEKADELFAKYKGKEASSDEWIGDFQAFLKPIVEHDDVDTFERFFGCNAELERPIDHAFSRLKVVKGDRIVRGFEIECWLEDNYGKARRGEWEKSMLRADVIRGEVAARKLAQLNANQAQLEAQARALGVNIDA